MVIRFTGQDSSSCYTCPGEKDLEKMPNGEREAGAAGVEKVEVRQPYEMAGEDQDQEQHQEQDRDVGEEVAAAVVAVVDDEKEGEVQEEMGSEIRVVWRIGVRTHTVVLAVASLAMPPEVLGNRRCSYLFSAGARGGSVRWSRERCLAIAGSSLGAMDGKQFERVG